MSKKRLLTCILAGVLLLCISGVLAYAAINETNDTQEPKIEDSLFIAGQHLGALQNEGVGANAETEIVAEYHGHKISSTILEYQKNVIDLLVSVGSAQYETDMEIINRIIKGIMLTEEAERLGIVTTEEEIDEYIKSAMGVYSTPEGKRAMDAYCQGAGMTLDEYIQMMREQMPERITHNKLKAEIHKQYCIDNDLEYDRNAPISIDMLAAEKAYIAALFERNKDDIVYYLDDAEVS